MKSLFRVLTSLVMMLAILLLASCTGAPGCPQAGFGTSTACSSSSGSGTFGGGGSGGGGGGGGGATPAAFAYAVDQNGGTNGTGANGTIDGFDLSTSAATFTAITNFSAPQIPASNTGAAMVVARKQFVYAMFDIANGIYGWSITSSNGALTALTGSPFAIDPTLPNVAYNQYNVTTDPAGNYLFISETGANAVLVYTINSSTGALTEVQSLSTPFEPGNMTTDGLGRYLYVSENFSGHTGGEIAAYTIGSGGTLTVIQGSPFTFTTGMWQIQGDPSGNYLIGTSGNSLLLSGSDDNHLYVFSIGSTGALTQASSAITTYSPFNIAVSPPSSDEEFVYSFSINDAASQYNVIEGYQLNTVTSGSVTAGTLTALSGSPFLSLTPPTAVGIGLWGQFDQSGQNLVVYSNTGATNLFDELVNGGGVVALTPLSVDSAGNLTEPITTPATLVTPGYWVVTDP